jgi:hypothetical protein
LLKKLKAKVAVLLNPFLDENR